MIVALEEADTSPNKEVVLLNSLRFNAYKDEWRPGMFMRHFAGTSPKAPAILAFVAEFPPNKWPGYEKGCKGHLWFEQQC